MQQQQNAVNEFDAMEVVRIGATPVTLGQLRAAFDSVADKANWKNPIAAELPADCTEFDRRVMEHAIKWFAGCAPEFDHIHMAGGRVRYLVRAVGYYVAVGA